MKKTLLLMIMTAAASAVYAAAPYEAEVLNTKVVKNGERLDVTFDIAAGKFPSNRRVHITPIVYNGNREWVALEPVVLVGKKRNKSDKRTGVTDGDRRLVTRKTPVVHYSGTTPYEEWMQYVAVAVDQVVVECCSQTDVPIMNVSDPQLIYYKITPYFDTTPLRYELSELEKYDIENPFLHPMEDYNKRYDILLNDRDKGTAAVVFKVGSAVIDTDFQGNGQVLDAVAKAFDLIENDPNAILKHIMVAGYASPEGSLATNTRLAAQRAEAVKKYLQTTMNEPMDHLFEVHNGREDWDGLRDLVSKSEMTEKDEIIRIIDSYTMEQEQRKTALKNLDGGAPYRYMLENFYPRLRTGGYVQVYYEIDRKATVATAVTDEFGRTTWIDPDSPSNRGVTAINKGLELIVDHKFDEALDILGEFKEDPRSWNLIGVCHMMKGNYAEADKYLLRAAEQGNEDAKKNLEQTGWAKKVSK